MGDKVIGIEIGLESADPWILRNCVNKSASLDTSVRAILAAHAHVVSVTANVLIGHAFLSPKEAIDDAVSTVRWAFAHGTDRCVLFPVHVKPWTLQVERMADFVREQAGKEQPVLLGVSGGIDSEVVARLVARALGSERLRCFTVLQKDFEQKYVENVREFSLYEHSKIRNRA